MVNIAENNIADAEIAEAKAALRQTLLARRKSLVEASHAIKSRAAARLLIKHVDLVEAAPLAVFWPLGREIDTRPLITALYHLGMTLLLPCTHARARPLTFHPWTPQTELETSAFGVQEPSVGLAPLDPTVIIVPLLGFDTQGYRLGYGAGHYDCTLADMAERGVKPLTVGLAFDLQRVDDLPRQAHDMPLDAIITEAAIYKPPA